MEYGERERKKEKREKEREKLAREKQSDPGQNGKWEQSIDMRVQWRMITRNDKVDTIG